MVPEEEIWTPTPIREADFNIYVQYRSLIYTRIINPALHHCKDQTISSSLLNRELCTSTHLSVLYSVIHIKISLNIILSIVVEPNLIWLLIVSSIRDIPAIHRVFHLLSPVRQINIVVCCVSHLVTITSTIDYLLIKCLSHLTTPISNCDKISPTSLSRNSRYRII